MSDYRNVVAAYKGFPAYGVPRNVVYTHWVTAGQEEQIADTFQRLQEAINTAETETVVVRGALLSKLADSPFNKYKLLRLAASQLDPQSLSSRRKAEWARLQASHLGTSRLFGAVMFDNMPKLPRPLRQMLPVTEHPNQVAQKLQTLADRLHSDEDKEITAPGGGQLIRFAGFNEKAIAGIALSECDPDSATRYIESGHMQLLLRDLGMLASSRTISLEMYERQEALHTSER